MSLRGQALLAAGAVALGFAAVAAGAAEEHARGGTGSPLDGSARGYEYRSHSENIPAGEVREISANCPAGKPVVGGGTRVFLNDTYINEAFPFDDSDSGTRTDDGYRTTISNFDGDAPAPATVYAICKRRDQGVRYAKSTVSGEGAPAMAQCPGKSKPTGGGATYTAAVLIREPLLSQSRPVGDPGTLKPDDAWRAVIDTGASEQTTTAFAMCLRTNRRPKSKRKIVYRQSQGDVEPNSTGNQPTLCPASKAAIGGGFLVDGSGTLLSSIFPFDGGDSGGAPDDGFDSRIRNGSGGERLLRTYAICN